MNSLRLAAIGTVCVEPLPPAWRGCVGQRAVRLRTRIRQPVPLDSVGSWSYGKAGFHQKQGREIRFEDYTHSLS